ncbi:MAG: hypothetical protein PHQ12_06915 [Chthoniobacteraceae bacterium]|nr:hypothetical protein [Chthoniobacteraceae bacterium]
MAEKPAVTRKAELAAELALARVHLSRAARDAGADLNVAARLKESVTHRKLAWFTGAAVAGWVLSRLPGRRKAPAASKTPELLSKSGRAGVWLAILNLVFKLFQPLLTTLATRKIGQLASRNDWEWRR